MATDESLVKAMSEVVADATARQEMAGIFSDARVVNAAPSLVRWVRFALDPANVPTLDLSGWKDRDIGEGLLFCAGAMRETWATPQVSNAIAAIVSVLASAAGVRLL